MIMIVVYGFLQFLAGPNVRAQHSSTASHEAVGERAGGC